MHSSTSLMLRRFCTLGAGGAASSPIKKKQLVFLGSPQVSASVLDTLFNASSAPDSLFEVAAVVTQPPSGRDMGRKVMPSPVAQHALDRGFPSDLIFTPVRAGEEAFLSELRSLEPELCITAFYGNILPSKFLKIPPLVLPRDKEVFQNQTHETFAYSFAQAVYTMYVSGSEMLSRFEMARQVAAEEAQQKREAIKEAEEATRRAEELSKQETDYLAQIETLERRLERVKRRVAEEVKKARDQGIRDFLDGNAGDEWLKKRTDDGLEIYELSFAKAKEMRPLPVDRSSRGLSSGDLFGRGVGTVNIHPSLLPLYRGAAPVQRALQDGVKETGVSLAFTVRALDAGPVIARETIKVNDHIKAPELLDLLFGLGSKLLIRELPSIIDGSARSKLETQDDSKASLAPKINPEESWLSFDQEASVLHNKVRAFAGWPGTRARVAALDKKSGQQNVLELKVITSRVCGSDNSQGGEADNVIFSRGSLVFPYGGSTALEVSEIKENLECESCLIDSSELNSANVLRRKITKDDAIFL
ncbi:hypothetical protein RJ639_009716 [Escallonia herrerae]|uniref:methionyl-tRNA formyltransferase n=1 Tax=Escallonia herrerae TaxID=1293975 RepID=A0AA88VPB2_9ASTE|nr:hypothetical protein RJ639_009716 [Escallonia herrerae]